MGNSLGHSLEPIKPLCPRNYPCPGDVSSDRPGSDKRPPSSEEQRVEHGMAKVTGVASFPSMPFSSPLTTTLNDRTDEEDAEEATTLRRGRPTDAHLRTTRRSTRRRRRRRPLG